MYNNASKNRIYIQQNDEKQWGPRNLKLILYRNAKYNCEGATLYFPISYTFLKYVTLGS